MARRGWQSMEAGAWGRPGGGRGAGSVHWKLPPPSAGPVDWKPASTIGAGLTGGGPELSQTERARLNEDFAELVPLAETMVSEFTGLKPEGYRARAWVMPRNQWIDQNLKGFQTVLEPLAARLLDQKGQGGSVRRKGLGLQVGLLMGYVSR